MPTPNSARRASPILQERKGNEGREVKDERDRRRASYSSPADFYNMSSQVDFSKQVKKEVGAIPIHPGLRPKAESFPPPPSAYPNRRNGDNGMEWNYRQRDHQREHRAPRERTRDWARLKIEPQKNLTPLKTAAEYPIWKFRWIHMMKVFLVPPSYYTDEDPYYMVPTRSVYDVDSGLSLTEKLVTDEMESYLFSLLLTNLDNKWIHLVTAVLDGNFRQAWFKIQAQFDGNSRRSRRTRKTAFFNLELHEGTSFTQFADSIREAGATLNRVLKRAFLNEEDLIDALFMGLSKHEAYAVTIAVLDSRIKDGKHLTFDDCVEDLKTVAVDIESAQGNIAWKQVRRSEGQGLLVLAVGSMRPREIVPLQS